MVTYKLFRLKDGRLFPLYVEHKREMKTGIWLEANIGELADENHVRSRGGRLALRPGFHSTLIPFTDWIGKRGPDGNLYQRPDTVWCECCVEGKEQIVTDRNGLRELPSDWYYFKTNTKQKDPWIISNRIYIRKLLSDTDVADICREHGVTPQPIFTG